jgi:hypothetical protein
MTRSGDPFPGSAAAGTARLRAPGTHRVRTQLGDLALYWGSGSMAIPTRARRARGPAVLALALILGAGCVVSPRVAHSVGQVATVALWTAAIAGQLMILSHHDDHLHHEHCGHYRRWHDGRWVYYYGGHWEYYDEPSAQWYFYAE